MSILNRKEEYIGEIFFKHGREYRIHVTEQGYFYTCRKMLKKDAEVRWSRHDVDCSWIKEENPLFDKPVNWDAIVADCVKALKTIGADVLAFDVKVQTAKDKKGNKRENPNWILIESASAPSFGEVTTQQYIKIIPQIVNAKLNPTPEKKLLEPKFWYVKPKSMCASARWTSFDKDMKVIHKVDDYACYADIFNRFNPNIHFIDVHLLKTRTAYPKEFLELYITWMNEVDLTVDMEEKEDVYICHINVKKLDKRTVVLSVLNLLRYFVECSYIYLPQVIYNEMVKEYDFIKAIQNAHLKANYDSVLKETQLYYGGFGGHTVCDVLDNYPSYKAFSKDEYFNRLRGQKSIYDTKNTNIPINNFWNSTNKM